MDLSETHHESEAPTSLRGVLNLDALGRATLGWGAVAALALAAPLLSGTLATGTLWALLAAVVAVILVCAFGVTTQAEHLARRLGDPYGTLVLTLSITAIEVILIMAVMLGPGDHATIARDSVVAVSFIITGLAFGVAALILGLRHGGVSVNRDGASNYMALIVVFVTMAFILPGLIGEDGQYTSAQQVPMIVLSLGLYAGFLWRQAGAQASEFQEAGLPAGKTSTTSAPIPASVQGAAPGGTRAKPGKPRRSWRAHRTEILARTVLLLVTVAPIVLLSNHMAVFLDDALGRADAPPTLSGVIIAAIVFLPETLTTLRAALAGEAQRVVNLCHGAQVATLGSTIPIVLLIGVLTGQDVVLAEEGTNLILLVLLLVLNLATFSARRVTAIHAMAHLSVFAMFVLALFS